MADVMKMQCPLLMPGGRGGPPSLRTGLELALAAEEGAGGCIGPGVQDAAAWVQAGPPAALLVLDEFAAASAGSALGRFVAKDERASSEHLVVIEDGEAGGEQRIGPGTRRVARGPALPGVPASCSAAVPSRRAYRPLQGRATVAYCAISPGE